MDDHFTRRRAQSGGEVAFYFLLKLLNSKGSITKSEIEWIRDQMTITGSSETLDVGEADSIILFSQAVDKAAREAI